ncbi:MAG: TlpA family protein disulfide reductase [Betaproteobacteria bacterium]|nr:TlpA family protein disulfide reductase [Betaproteobacteria bacterium]
MRCAHRLHVLAGILAALAAAPAAFAIAEGQPAPAYDIRLLDGQQFASTREAGHVVMLHFWASWCVPCRAEMPAMERYYRAHHAQGFDLVAISMDSPEDMDKARALMKPFSFPGAWIQDASVRGYGRIWRIPLTFVIDRQGVLRHDAWDGGDAGITDAALEQALTPLLEAK